MAGEDDPSTVRHFHGTQLSKVLGCCPNLRSFACALLRPIDNQGAAYQTAEIHGTLMDGFVATPVLLRDDDAPFSAFDDHRGVLWGGETAVGKPGASEFDDITGLELLLFVVNDLSPDPHVGTGAFESAGFERFVRQRPTFPVTHLFAQFAFAEFGDQFRDLGGALLRGFPLKVKVGHPR